MNSFVYARKRHAVGIGKVDEIFTMPEQDQGELVKKLVDWDPGKKVKVDLYQFDMPFCRSLTKRSH